MILAAWYHILSSLFFAFLAVLLMLVILLQRGKGVGLSGAFGGAGGNTAFGAKTGDVLTWATIALAGIFLFVAVLLNLFVFTPPKATLGGPAVLPANSPTGPEDGERPPPRNTPAPVPLNSTPATKPAAAPATTPPTTPAIAPATTTPASPAPGAAPAAAPTSAPAEGHG